MYIFHLLGTHRAVDDLEDDCYIILMNSNNTGLFFITQTDLGEFSATKTVFCTFGQDFSSFKAGWLPLETYTQGVFPMLFTDIKPEFKAMPVYTYSLLLKV